MPEPAAATSFDYDILKSMKKILCVGPTWRGSNAGGMFRALSRIGNLISVVDENYYINLSNETFKVKAIDKIFRNWHIQEFNNAILNEANAFEPDFVLVYKGAFVLPQTLLTLKQKGLKLVNFYPDVSFRTHGSLLAQTLPLYDHVFTTKTFGIKDMEEQLGVSCSTFIPHGFDPDIHKKLNISGFNNQYYDCDVSFIGGWSAKKESLLAAIKINHPNVNLKIWGSRWENCKKEILQSSIQRASIYGDLYTIGILSSRINLGLLHEKVQGASSGDLITSRTFHIPGAGGFMLHERSPEIGNYFQENKEIACFGTEEELAEKVSYYLLNAPERAIIAEKGYERALKEHSLDKRAEMVMSHIKLILDA